MTDRLRDAPTTSDVWMLISTQSVLAWFVAAVISVVSILLIVDSVTSGSDAAGGSLGGAMWFVPPPLFAVPGALIVSRRRGNRVGWLLLMIGAALSLDGAAGVIVALIDGPPDTLMPWLFLVLLIENVSWMLWLFPFFLLLYSFPSGNLLSRRWRWAPILEIVLAMAVVVPSIIGTEIGPFDRATTWVILNPIGFVDTATIEAILTPFVLGLLALAVGGVVAIILRYRRSPVDERTQIKWVMFAFAVFCTAYVYLLVNEAWDAFSVLDMSILVAGTAAVPVAITIAIFKFRLFDIDVIISKSLTFGVLAVFIGGVYVAIVVGIGELFDQAGGSSLWLSVAATAVVAIAFQPVRSRVETWANRLVYGKRATPYEVLARFSHRAADESDDDVLGRIPRLIVDGTGASEAALWVRSAGGFRTASVWPQSAAARTIGDSDGFEDRGADLSLPVFHDDELLGGISLVNARGVTTAPPERELLANLAGGLGLTLRNSQLTSALRQQVKDLQRSRDRVVSAADEARRSLEHDLDSGPQQQLVAVKVKLGPVRKLAEQAGATRTAEVLADIESQAGDAIQAVRDFAAGIYPPLLGAEGLVVALSQETHKAALPVELDTNGVGRYPRDVEAAVYFSILEALQNTAKYAQAASGGPAQ